MKELFSLLTLRERRAASIAGAAFGAAAVLFLFIGLRERAAAGRAAFALAAAESNSQALGRARNEAKREWQAWADARNDLDAVKISRLYPGRTAIQDLRLDLQRIFDDVGVTAEDMTYGYLEIVKESLQAVMVEFRFSSNFATLIRLLNAVERHPRFLHVAKIDFLNIGNPPGALNLRVGLMGYYER
jgi:hypothetical protein